MRKISLSMIILFLLAACGTPEGTTTGAIGSIIDNPPDSATMLEVKAYRSLRIIRDIDKGLTPCPTLRSQPILTDVPVISNLVLVNSSFPNGPLEARYPQDKPWLIAVYAGELPYYGRLRGHVRDEKYKACPNNERIFVVEKVVETYSQALPADGAEIVVNSPGAKVRVPKEYQEWPEILVAAEIKLRYPQDAQPELTTTGAIIKFVTGEVATIHVYDRETPYSPSDQTVGQDVFRGRPAEFDQAIVLPNSDLTGGLSGYFVHRTEATDAPSMSIFFIGSGKTYEYTLQYHTGYDAKQDALTAFTLMVASFKVPNFTPPAAVAAPLPAASAALVPAAIEGLIHGSFGEQAIISSLQRGTQDQGRAVAPACKDLSSLSLGVWIAQVNSGEKPFYVVYDAIAGSLLCAANEYNPIAPSLPTPTMRPASQPPERRPAVPYPTPSR